jgi:hypothetical protein
MEMGVELYTLKRLLPPGFVSIAWVMISLETFVKRKKMPTDACT